MRVSLMTMTRNPVAVIYAAARQCYSQEFAADIYALRSGKGGVSEKEKKFVQRIMSSGHESPLEHVQFTFAVEGVSRALTHQLVRHRIASYSQQSQRYVKESDFDFVIPPVIKRNAKLRARYISLMRRIQNTYDFLLAHTPRGKREDAVQDARFVLPQAAETKIVVTMNARELIHFFQLRTCSRAQWEIRALALRMLGICRTKLPEVFAHAGPKCEKNGYCPETAEFSCGRYPVKENASCLRA